VLRCQCCDLQLALWMLCSCYTAVAVAAVGVLGDAAAAAVLRLRLLLLLQWREAAGKQRVAVDSMEKLWHMPDNRLHQWGLASNVDVKCPCSRG
jgi:hypothetical protein